jgi:hypothetical protein
VAFLFAARAITWDLRFFFCGQIQDSPVDVLPDDTAHAVNRKEKPGMMNESLLREKVREAMHAGELPDRAPDQVWGGPGTGARCAVCGASTKRDETELEIEFSSGHRSGPTSYYVHLRCYSILELERRNVPTAAVSERLTAQVVSAEPANRGHFRRNGSAA